MKLTIGEFRHAYELLSDIINPTPLVYNEWLSRKFKSNIYLKLENMLPIGSFKMRGATYKIANLSPQKKKNGVLAVSAGNHAQGVAWAAHQFGVKATIIMPETSPMTKVQNTESLGAKVILHGNTIEEGFEYAEKMLKKSKLTFIHPYKDKDVILGQGSVAFELVDQLPEMDYIFSSIGGGGLVAGIGSVINHMKPKVQVIAGQASGTDAMATSLKNKRLTQKKTTNTFADGIKVRKASAEMYKILKEVVDQAVSISDDKIAQAVLQLIENARVIAEGAGAVPLAVLNELYQKSPKKFAGKNIVLVICGGNIDVNVLERIIDRGMIESNRKVKFTVPIQDEPGVLHTLTGIVQESGANILQIVHDRDAHNTGITGTNVYFNIETRGRNHLESLMKRLKKDFPDCQIVS